MESRQWSLASGGWRELLEFSRRKKLGTLKCGHERLPWAKGARVTSVKSQLERREHRAGTECSRKLKQLSNANLGLEGRVLQVLRFPARVCRSRLSFSFGKTVGPLSGSRQPSQVSSALDGKVRTQCPRKLALVVGTSQWLPPNNSGLATHMAATKGYPTSFGGSRESDSRCVGVQYLVTVVGLVKCTHNFGYCLVVTVTVSFVVSDIVS